MGNVSAAHAAGATARHPPLFPIAVRMGGVECGVKASTSNNDDVFLSSANQTSCNHLATTAESTRPKPGVDLSKTTT